MNCEDELNNVYCITIYECTNRVGRRARHHRQGCGEGVNNPGLLLGFVQWSAAIGAAKTGPAAACHKPGHCEVCVMSSPVPPV